MKGDPMPNETHVEKFANEVAATANNVSIADIRRATSDPDAQLNGAGAVEWVILVELIMSVVMNIIDKCREPETIKRSVKNPSRWQRVIVKRAVSGECRCCVTARWNRDAGGIADTILNLAARKSDAEIDAAIGETTDPDNFLI